MSLLSFMIILALLATIGALGAGVVSMVRGGEYDRQHDTQLMIARVSFQGVALVLLLFALYFATF
ncbi:MAG: twin transmembrane helix small protein [Gammaproteobacteria bacterium]|nr:twin transmembrane helix small protein [Gammaproteobacteria bacterium]NIM72901.1 twin transmembrane helix small protein [Gammaproteobacteria bacterium]NIN38512.1 twin transmembrane helix small protein [Gammaproteobacteria bacterium]NIO24653.1 twin transmembrane helix small protein [Gammaproteobacteria bacterium]NIO65256.1 twin transmembrane helix small protein [Gammaproteobacteria bacterium]